MSVLHVVGLSFYATVSPLAGMQHLQNNCFRSPCMVPASIGSITVSGQDGTAHLASRAAPVVRPQGRVCQQRSFAGRPRTKLLRSTQCRAATPQSTKLDSSMIWGDIMMLTATELASERLPKQVTGVLSLTLLAAWIGVAAAKGDYTVKRRHTFTYEYAYATLLGMQQAAITWLLFVPTAMAMYACLVSHHLLDSSVFKVPPGSRTSPEGEIMLAALFTLMSWRGIYSSQMF